MAVDLVKICDDDVLSHVDPGIDLLDLDPSKVEDDALQELDVDSQDNSAECYIPSEEGAVSPLHLASRATGTDVLVPRNSSYTSKIPP